VKVNNKEGFGWDDFLTTFIFLAFDTAIATCKFGTECAGDLIDGPVCVEREKE
jgi:hypothetical protein